MTCSNGVFPWDTHWGLVPISEGKVEIPSGKAIATSTGKHDVGASRIKQFSDQVGSDV